MCGYTRHGRDVMGMYKRLLSYASPTAKTGELRRKKARLKRDREKCYQETNRWRRNHPESRLVYCAKRRERKHNSIASDRVELKKIYTKAKELRNIGWKINVHHVIALSEGGMHAPDNVVILRECDHKLVHKYPNYKPEVLF